MNAIGSPNDCRVRVRKPYLTKDIMGNYVILQDETVFCKNPTIQGHKLIFSSEILVDDSPSEKEIFKYKLKGAVKGNTFLTGRPTADS